MPAKPAVLFPDRFLPAITPLVSTKPNVIPLQLTPHRHGRMAAYLPGSGLQHDPCLGSLSASIYFRRAGAFKLDI